VYVRHFPNINEGKWTISTGGGRHPAWAPNGREWYYAMGSTIYAVSVDAKGNSFVAGAPEMLFSGPFDLLTTDYTLSVDGTRFIMIESDPQRAANADSSGSQLGRGSETPHSDTGAVTWAVGGAKGWRDNQWVPRR
jgi:hypothetical protein